MIELLYGRHAVLEALRAGRRRIQRIYLGQGTQQTGIVAEIVAAAQQRGCPVTVASRQVLDRAGPVNHQGVVAEAGPYPYVTLDALMPAPGAEAPLYLALDHLQDVQNLGTLLRTAEAMAVTGVLLPDRRAASITPAVVNASSGAVEHLRIAEIGNLVQTIERLKQEGVWVVGLDASPDAVPLRAGRSARAAGARRGRRGRGPGPPGARALRLAAGNPDVWSGGLAQRGGCRLDRRDRGTPGARRTLTPNARKWGRYLTFHAPAHILTFRSDRCGCMYFSLRNTLHADVAQSAEHRPCKSRVAGSIPAVGLHAPYQPGQIPKWPKGADCKSAGNAFGGSNPPLPTSGI